MDTPDLLPIGDDPSLLIVDDDAAFRNRLARAMEGRGFAVSRGQSGGRRLPLETGGCRRYRERASRPDGGQTAAARKPDVRRPRTVGTYPAGL